MTQLCIEKGVSEFGCNAISWGLVFCYIIFAMAILSALGLALFNTLKNPSSLVKSGIGIGALLVVLIIGYALSDSTRSTIAVAQNVSESSSRWIGAGLIMFYLALFVAAAGLIYSEISKALK